MVQMCSWPTGIFWSEHTLHNTTGSASTCKLLLLCIALSKVVVTLSLTSISMSQEVQVVGTSSKSVSLSEWLSATSTRQLGHMHDSSDSAASSKRLAHGKCHHVLQVSQQTLFSTDMSVISGSSSITLSHFGHWKISLYPNKTGKIYVL